jgi:hypothetical protein
MTVENQQLAPTQLQPEAQYVNTYAPYQPSSPALGTQLADTLRSFSPALNTYMNQRWDREEAAAKGLAQQHQELRDYQAAVKAGVTRPGMGAIFVRAYNEQAAVNTAVRATSQWEANYRSDPSAASGDSNAFDQFMQTQINAATAGVSDPYQRRAMNPIIQRHIDAMYGLRAQAIADRAEAGYRDELGTAVGNALTQAVQQSWSTQQPVDTEALNTAVNRLKNTARAVMIPGDEVNKITADAYLNTALRAADNGDASYMNHIDALSQLQWKGLDGTTAPGPISIPAIRDKVTEVQHEAGVRYMRAQEAIVRQQEVEKKAEQNELLSTIVPQLMLSRQPLSPADQTRVGRAFGYETLEKLNQAVATGRTLYDYDSPHSLQRSLLDLFTWDGKDAAALVPAITSLRNESDIRDIGSQMLRLKEQGGADGIKGGLERLRNNPVFAPYVKAIDAELNQGAVPGSIPIIAKMFPPSGVERANAMAGFLSDLVGYAASDAYKNATQTDRLEYVHKYAQGLETTATKLYGDAFAAGTKPAAKPRAPADKQLAPSGRVVTQPDPNNPFPD